MRGHPPERCGGMFRFRGSETPIEVVGAEEVRHRLESGQQVAILDLREPVEFGRGHIPGARLLPLSRLAACAGDLDPGREWILVCGSGRRSAEGCRLLARHGFRRALNMAGGMNAWRGPVVKDG